jgi:hypothetical protein
MFFLIKLVTTKGKTTATDEATPTSLFLITIPFAAEKSVATIYVPMAVLIFFIYYVASVNSTTVIIGS